MITCSWAKLFPISMFVLEADLLSKAPCPSGKHAQLIGSFPNFPRICIRINVLVMSSFQWGAWWRSHILSATFFVLLAEFNLACKCACCTSEKWQFSIALGFLAFHRAAWSHWSQFCWFSQVKVPPPFCLIRTKSYYVLAEYSPIRFFWMHTGGYKLIHMYPKFYLVTLYCFQCWYHFRSILACCMSV